MLRHLFTTADNTTGDIGRVLWAVMIFAFILQSSWAVTHGQQFDPVQWSTGAAALLLAGGGALKLKQSTEPPA